MRKAKRLMTLLAISLVLSSCTQTRIFQIPQIEVPPAIILPAVFFTREEGKICLDEHNAKTLYEREQLLQNDNDQLRELINSLNKEFGIDE